MPAQSLFGSVIIFHAQADNWFALGLRDERVEIVNVELGFEQSAHEPIEVGRICFHNDEVALGKGKVFSDEQLTGTVRIIHDDANDGAVSRVEHHQTQDMNIFGTEQANQIVKPANFVWCEDGELDYRVCPPRLRGCGRHNFDNSA